MRCAHQSTWRDLPEATRHRPPGHACGLLVVVCWSWSWCIMGWLTVVCAMLWPAGRTCVLSGTVQCGSTISLGAVMPAQHTGLVFVSTRCMAWSNGNGSCATFCQWTVVAGWLLAGSCKLVRVTHQHHCDNLHNPATECVGQDSIAPVMSPGQHTGAGGKGGRGAHVVAKGISIFTLECSNTMC